MFKLFPGIKKTSANDVFALLRTDMHSHLLPGIDDGSPDMETSLRLIRGMTGLGFTKLITTPHILWEMYPNTRDGILRKLDELREEVNREGINTEIHAAAEYFLDEHVAGLVKRNEPLLTLNGTMVLTEFSLAWQPHGVKEILFDMQMQGYQPVIAHPERYVYLQANKEYFEELKEAGCLFQLNFLSLTGHYGKSVQELAQYLVKKNHYDLIGTDLHHMGHLEKLQNLAHSALPGLLSSGNLLNSSL